MKLTKEEVNHLKNNKSFKTEGILKKIFAKLLTKKLKKDPDFIRAVDAADKSMSDLQIAIRKAEENGVKIPAELKKSAGL